jgi:hypothetical protein|tara:strand:- start:4 stop:201 length:198 start_codon:yes stop_codon:yes gene_type:complete
MKIAINGIIRECTPEEEAKILDERSKVTVVEKSYSEDKAEKKASGKQKLKDLGLDDDEIQALMGA